MSEYYFDDATEEMEEKIQQAAEDGEYIDVYGDIALEYDMYDWMISDIRQRIIEFIAEHRVYVDTDEAKNIVKNGLQQLITDFEKIEIPDNTNEF